MVFLPTLSCAFQHDKLSFFYLFRYLQRFGKFFKPWHKGIHPDTIEFLHGEHIDFEKDMTKHERTDWKKNRGLIGHALMKLIPFEQKDIVRKISILENHYLKEDNADWFGHESEPLVQVYRPFVEVYVYWYHQCFQLEKIDNDVEEPSVPHDVVFDLACLFPKELAPPLVYAAKFHQMLMNKIETHGREQWHIDERVHGRIPKWAHQVHVIVHRDTLRSELKDVGDMKETDIMFFSTVMVITLPRNSHGLYWRCWTERFKETYACFIKMD